jgi:hypothetical protein
MNPAWDVSSEDKEGWDLGFASIGVGGLSINRHESDLAVVSGPQSYDTCERATEYSGGLYHEDLKEGLTACVKTSESRFAYITIKKLVGDREKIQLEVTVWDPPFEE